MVRFGRTPYRRVGCIRLIRQFLRSTLTTHSKREFGGALEAGFQVALDVDEFTIASAGDATLMFIAEQFFKDAREGFRIVDGSQIASFEDRSHPVDARRDDRKALGHRLHYRERRACFPARGCHEDVRGREA